MPSIAGLQSLLRRFMYHDTATVMRQMATVDDEGADDYDVQVIYEDIPCKLSQYGKDISTAVTDRQADISMDFRLTCDPSYDIKPNDIIRVQHEGQEFLLNAAMPFKYKTHLEISLRRKDEAR